MSIRALVRVKSRNLRKRRRRRPWSRLRQMLAEMLLPLLQSQLQLLVARRRRVKVSQQELPWLLKRKELFKSNRQRLMKRRTRDLKKRE